MFNIRHTSRLSWTVGRLSKDNRWIPYRRCRTHNAAANLADDLNDLEAKLLDEIDEGQEQETKIEKEETTTKTDTTKKQKRKSPESKNGQRPGPGTKEHQPGLPFMPDKSP